MSGRGTDGGWRSANERICIESTSYDDGSDGGRGSGGSGTVAIYSDDHGETWKLGGANQSGSIEPNITELEDGRLMINARNGLRVEPGRLISISTDGGAGFQPQKADPPVFQPYLPGNHHALLQTREPVVEEGEIPSSFAVPPRAGAISPLC